MIVFGIFSIYSVSIFESFDLTLDLVELGVRTDRSNYYYFTEQLGKLAIGLLLATIVWFVPLSGIRKAKWVVFFSTLLLMFLLFTPMGITLNGSSAWLDVPGGTIQP